MIEVLALFKPVGGIALCWMVFLPSLSQLPMITASSVSLIPAFLSPPLNICLSSFLDALLHLPVSPPPDLSYSLVLVAANVELLSLPASLLLSLDWTTVLLSCFPVARTQIMITLTCFLAAHPKLLDCSSLLLPSGQDSDDNLIYLFPFWHVY